MFVFYHIYYYFYRVSYLAGEFARILIRKLREDQSKVEPWKFDKDDEMNILCVEIAGLCHDLGKIIINNY